MEGTGKFGSAKLSLVFLDCNKASILSIAEALRFESVSMSLKSGVTENHNNLTASSLTGSDINPVCLGRFNHPFICSHIITFQSSLGITEDPPMTDSISSQMKATTNLLFFVMQLNKAFSKYNINKLFLNIA